MKDITLLYIDLFCGAGGTSEGVESARLNGRQCAKVIGCVNHDANAIASHAANHPDALHLTEDIRTLELSPLVKHMKKMRKRHPSAFVVLWASLECTNFSKAKGGKPRDADSRTLAEHLFRYIEALNPDFIQIENVEEFMSWGDLDENGKPISRDAGRLYKKWVESVKGYGYNFEHRMLNAADFGAYTSRRRFFGIFAKYGLPIVFPAPTHSKTGAKSLFENLKKWKPVRDVLDFTDEGESIFGRKKPLVEATLERIYAGLIKFVAGGKDKWLLKYNSINGTTRIYTYPSVDIPCSVVSCQNRLEKASTSFLSKGFSGDPYSKNTCINCPAGAITTKDHHYFLSVYYGNGHNHSVNEPAPTLTTKDRISFLEMQYGNGTPCAIDAPAQTVTTNPKHRLVACYSLGMNTNRKWYYLMNPQFASPGGSVDKPCFTLIARMDKMPPYLITAETSDIAIKIEESDTPAMIKIKEFMAIYGIVDIKTRMLKIPELKQIMGFPKNYVLIGNKSEQKKFIGNAVEVTMSRKLCEALCWRLSTSDFHTYND